MSESPVFIFDSTSPAMEQAIANARKQFRFFWREMTWEARRIVPGLGMAAIKAPFSDPPRPPGLLRRWLNLLKGDKGNSNGDGASDTPSAEQMWISDIEFDGDTIRGVLLNQPNWVRSVQEGDPVSVPLDEVSDWMYVIDDHVYGAYTVQAIRASMSPGERAAHDEAWGLVFPDPSTVKLMPDDWKGDDEHPMALNMAKKMSEELGDHPEYLQFADESGWTMLHGMAAGGSVVSCRVLLEHGADVNSRTNKGDTPLTLAQRLGWSGVAQVLRESGGHER